jgi:hypothetical protein
MTQNKIISKLKELGFDYFMSIGLHGIYVKDDINISIGETFFNVSNNSDNVFYRCLKSEIKNLDRNGEFLNVELWNSCVFSLGGLK